MRILYGVQGTGNGHIARARAMAHALQKRGVDVDFLFSGRAKDKFFSMEEFGDYLVYQGLTFVSHNGKLSYARTCLKNNVLAFWREVACLDLSNYDLILNDFEPVSAWAAKRQQKTVISISHQNAFRHAVPLRGANWLDKKIIEHFAPATHHIGLHWYHFEQPILPPIVHTHSGPVASDDFVLVYLPFENLSDISELLLRFSSQTFVCYHPEVIEAQQLENCQLLPLSFEGFQHHLHRCSGVIANGGFELPSEALTLGKKLLLKPLSGQFEQLSNVATLEDLGMATCMESLEASTVRQWLDEEPAESVNYPDVAQAITDWVLLGNWHCQESLTSNLWEKVDFPSYVTNI